MGIVQANELHGADCNFDKFRIGATPKTVQAASGGQYQPNPKEQLFASQKYVVSLWL